MSQATDYSVTVEIEQTTLDTLRQDPNKVLIIVRDIKRDSNVEFGNIVFRSYPSNELSNKQTFHWKDIHSVAETTDDFAVSVYILSLMAHN